MDLFSMKWIVHTNAHSGPSEEIERQGVETGDKDRSEPCKIKEECNEANRNTSRSKHEQRTDARIEVEHTAE